MLQNNLTVYIYICMYIYVCIYMIMVLVKNNKIISVVNPIPEVKSSGTVSYRIV
jgi:hypothetical protein